MVDGDGGFADFLAGAVEQLNVAFETFGLAGRVVFDAELLQTHREWQVLHQIAVGDVQKRDVCAGTFRNLHASPE